MPKMPKPQIVVSSEPAPPALAATINPRPPNTLRPDEVLSMMSLKPLKHAESKANTSNASNASKVKNAAASTNNRNHMNNNGARLDSIKRPASTAITAIAGSSVAKKQKTQKPCPSIAEPNGAKRGAYGQYECVGKWLSQYCSNVLNSFTLVQDSSGSSTAPTAPPTLIYRRTTPIAAENLTAPNHSTTATNTSTAMTASTATNPLASHILSLIKNSDGTLIGPMEFKFCCLKSLGEVTNSHPMLEQFVLDVCEQSADIYDFAKELYLKEQREQGRHSEQGDMLCGNDKGGEQVFTKNQENQGNGGNSTKSKSNAANSSRLPLEPEASREQSASQTSKLNDEGKRNLESNNSATSNLERVPNEDIVAEEHHSPIDDGMDDKSVGNDHVDDRDEEPKSETPTTPTMASARTKHGEAPEGEHTASKNRVEENHAEKKTTNDMAVSKDSDAKKKHSTKKTSKATTVSNDSDNLNDAPILDEKAALAQLWESQRRESEARGNQGNSDNPHGNQRPKRPIGPSTPVVDPHSKEDDPYRRINQTKGNSSRSIPPEDQLEMFSAYLKKWVDMGCCMNVSSKRDKHLKPKQIKPPKHGFCLHKLSELDCRRAVAKFCIKHAHRSREDKFEYYRTVVRYANVRFGWDDKAAFLMPFEHMGEEGDVDVAEKLNEEKICLDCFMVVHGFRRSTWESMRELVEGTKATAKHALTGKRGNNTMDEEITVSLHAFFEELLKENSTSKKGKKKEDKVIYLPSELSMRNCYIRWCFDRGYIATGSSNGKFELSKRPNTTPRRNPKKIVAYQGEYKECCSWSSFYAFWQRHYDHLKAQPTAKSKN